MLVPSLNTALPLLTTVPECAEFSKTVAPYIPQLYDLPYKILAHYNDLDALKHIYLSTNPLVTAVGFSVFLSVVVLIVSEINKNYSQVDRLWSIIPVIYNCHYSLWAHLSGIPAHRVDHVMAVSILWGARLTFNYWRKGGYSVGSEDYRWAIVKKNVGSFWMVILNIAFISLGQNLLLLAITTPTYILLLVSRITGDNIDTFDSVFSKLMLTLVVIEFFADQQQWNYHKAKTIYQESAKTPKEYNFTREQLDRGFNTSGLWAYSRHPNFAAEQAFWVSLYQWACCQTWSYLNWAFVAAISYLFLFQASTWLTELLSAGKYPEYKVYQKRVGKFLPKRDTKSMEEVKSVEEKKVEAKSVGKSTGKSSGAGSVGKGKGKKR
ncbi:hypothetical protein B0J11DRAFT_454182 [Dendryphion nanum]|uniref:DUF1295-domain-containing protein n=1 Tax=Dendryphion nanum TaxID=256645 RepID=A0A9P9EEH1_9PLEO|nr:hypothetical protein B0J11DRAFT_454182 [Dendryphion nanum]